MNGSIESILQNKLKLIWNDLSFKTHKNKVIINKLNGEVVSGRLTAILGPSGSGKTTFIECIANRRKKGVSGNVCVKHTNRKKINVRIAYNSQNDALIGLLTVEESLQYASQLRNFNSKKYDFFNDQQNNGLINGNCSHNNDLNYNYFPDENLETKFIEKKYSDRIYIQNMIKVFGLEQCANVRAFNCSGGQKKRLTIALELMFSPNILLLDEPTSGLDSVSSLQCVSLLKKLSKNKEPLIIAASVHQPSAKILTHFDHIYVLSVDGHCIYNGSTDALIDHLSTFDLICPLYHNPADFMLEIANGDHGKQAVENLIECEQNKAIFEIRYFKEDTLCITKYSPNNLMRNQLIKTWILLKRCFLIGIRHPITYWARILGCIMSLGAKYFLYSHSRIGEQESCMNTTSLIQTFKSITTNAGNFEIQLKNYPNIGYIFTLVIFIHVCSLVPTLMTFPLELSSFVKERFNKWYTSWSYFMAKSLADLPSIIIFPLIYSTLLYIITHQTGEMWRFYAHLSIITLFSLLSHSLGLLISAFFINKMNAALISFAVIFFPLLLFSGFLIPINELPKILQYFSYLSIFRLSLESLILVIYGFNRCEKMMDKITVQQMKSELGVDLLQIDECFSYSDSLPNITQGFNKMNNHLMHRNPSQVLEFFLLEDNSLYINIILMIIYTILLRVLAYYVLKWRTKVN